VTSLTVAGQGTYTVNTNGTVTFNPESTFTGTATAVRYQITDSQATPETTSAYITPTVIPTPSATADTSTDLLNIIQSNNPLTNDSAGSSTAPLDASTVRLCGSSQTPPNCTATTLSVTGGTYSVSTTTGIITFTPATNWFGTAPAATYQVSDSVNQVASSTYTPTVVATPTASPDTSEGAWNTDQTISPFANDTIASGRPLGSLALCGTSPVETPNSCSQPTLTTADGTYTVNANGTVTFDPLPTFTGTVTVQVTYQAKDNLNQFVSSTITPRVTAPTPPTAVADTTSNLVNVIQTMSVLANDTTIDPLITLTASSVRLCSSGQTSPNCNATSVPVTGGTYSVDTTTGVVSFTPTTDWSGTPTPVAYQVTDSTNQKVSSTYAPTVIAKPAATNDISDGDWNVNQTITPLSNDAIATGHPLISLKLCGSSETPNTCTQTTLEVSGQGTYTVNANGTVTFDPLPTFRGTATPITYQAVDDLGQYVSATITPTVRPPAAPTAVADTSSDFLNVVQTKSVLGNDTTIDPLITLSASSVRLCGAGQTAPGCTATSVSVTGGTYSVNTTTGVVSFTPTTDVSGTAPAVTYQVTDSTNQTVSATYTPTVFAKPSADDDLSSGAHDTNQTISPLGTDTFSSNNPVVLSSLKLCDSGETPNACTKTSLTVANQGTYTVNADGTVTFDPLPTFRGTATPVKYQAVDTLGQYVDATITPTVVAPTAPTATAQTQSVLRGGTATYTKITGASGLATGTQLQTSGDNATCLYTPSTTTCDDDNVIEIAGQGTFTLNPTTGVVTYVADANATAGTKTAITYRVTDITGQTATSTLTPVVPPAPTARANTSTGNYQADQTITPLTNDDPGDASAPLVATSVLLCGISPSETPPNCNQRSLSVGGEGTYTVNNDGSVLFEPVSTFTGTATAISYQVSDSLGQVADSTITVTVRTPPDARNDTSSADYDTNQTINPFTNDVAGSGTLTASSVRLCGADQVAPDCDKTSLSVSGEGTYTVNTSTGVVTFDPLPTFTGQAAAITYQVADQYGQIDSATITPTVGLPPIPTATANTSRGDYDTNQTINPLTNDTPGSSSFPLLATSVKLCGIDPAQSPNSCTQTSLTIAGEGTYNLNTTTGVVTFNPLPTFSGTVATAVRYQAKDSLDRYVNSTITPTVDPPPAPVATPETKAVLAGASVEFTTITGTTGLASGTGLKTSGTGVTCLYTPGSTTCDADNVVTISGEGTFTLNPTTGVVTYVALANATSGTKTSITYRVTDIVGQTDTETLTPIVPPRPTATADTSTGDWDVNQTISPLTNDRPGDASAPLVTSTLKLCGSSETAPNCTKTSLTVAGEGTYTVNANGTVTFDPEVSFTDRTATAVPYRIEDSLGQVAHSTITPTVGAAPVPVAVNDISSGAWDTNQTITPLSNDTANAKIPLVASTVKLCGLTPSVQTPPNCTQTSLTIDGQGTYTVNADGTVTFDPVSTLTTTVATPPRYQVADTLGQVVNATITPTVAAPPPPIASPGTVSLIAGGTETFSSIFGTSGLARKDTGGPDLTTSSVCIIAPSTTTCDPDNIVAISGQGTFTLDPATGIVTYEADPTATDGVKTAVTYKIVDALNVAATSTLTPTIYPKPTALPDYSMGVMEATQTLSPFGNDSPGAAANPLEKSSIKLCGVGETAPACTKTSVTVTGQGTYAVQSNGTVTFEPTPTFTGTATAMPYVVTDSLGQKAHSTLNPEVVPPPAPITELDTGTAEQGSTVVLSPWTNDDPGAVPDGVTGEVALVPSSIRLCGPTDAVPDCSRTSLTTDDGTYTVNTSTGRVTFVHRADFLGTVTQPVTYQIANDWTGASGIGISTNLLIPTIVAPAPAPAPAPASESPAPSSEPTRPRAQDDTLTSDWDTTQTYSPLANDSFTASDAQIASLKLCAAGESPNICTQMTVVVEGQGTYTVNSDGTVTFDPVPAFFGTATPITYQAMDMLGRYVDAKIMPIVLEPPDDAKVFDQSTSTKPGVPEWLVPTTNGIPSRGATFVDATLRLRDEKTNSWILSVKTKDGKWDVIKGKVRFTPNMDFRGETTLPYSVQDTEGVVLQAMLVVVVSETPETPKTGMSPYGLLLTSFTMLMIGLFLRRRTSVHA
jgi:CshA-type fibril repeat protein